MVKKAKKERKASRYMDYPDSKLYRGGCKVAWHYYAAESDAKECAKAAMHNAKLQAADGYDFGYCSPGSIRLMEAGEYKGLYEVCLP